MKMKVNKKDFQNYNLIMEFLIVTLKFNKLIFIVIINYNIILNKLKLS